MRRWNSVFANLAISYSTIAIVIVLLLCSIFYMYVPRSYNEEIRDKSQMMLENAANRIESSVIERVNQIYLDVMMAKSANLDLYSEESLQGHYSSIIDIQDLLKREVVNNADLLHAIHLYYPKSNVMISSLFGLQYDIDPNGGALRTMDWIDKMEHNDSSFLWTETRMVPKDFYSSVSSNNAMLPLVTYARSYPFQSTGEACDLMVGIDIRESAISGIIGGLMPAEYGSTYLIDPHGTILSAADKSKLGTRAAQSVSIERMLASPAAAQSFNETIDGISYVISDQRLSSTGWTIYTITQQNNFYKKSIVVQKVILAVCLLAVLIGIVLSGIFTMVSYHPIRRLVNTIKGLFDYPAETRHNEYKLIDKAIHTLSSKVVSLEDTLLANKPMIKHNVVVNLLRNSYKADELEEQLSSINLSMRFSGFCCLVIDPASEGFEALDSKTAQYAVYKLINQLEAADYEGTCLIAEELPDRKVAVLVCTNHPGDALLEQLSNQIAAEARTGFGLDFRIAAGLWVQACTDVHRSFSTAQIMLKYGYFVPEASMLRAYNLLNREHSRLELPQSALLKFKEKLQSRSLDGVTKAIDGLVAELAGGLYSADYGHFVLRNMAAMHADFLRTVKFNPPGQCEIDPYRPYDTFYHIGGFREWLVHSIAECYEHMEKRSDDRASASIEAVKRHIGANLSEDLSLDAVAAEVFISAKYLSKIFKEETGVGYTDYVTQKRMERALELMNDSGMTVEQIAGAVGYGTTAYFIKKFKEMNGCTPRTYARNMLKHG